MELKLQPVAFTVTRCPTAPRLAPNINIILLIFNKGLYSIEIASSDYTANYKCRFPTGPLQVLPHLCLYREMSYNFTELLFDGARV